MENLATLLVNSGQLKQIHAPQLMRLNNAADKQVFDTLLAAGKVTFVIDEMFTQLQELIKGRNPSIKISLEEYPQRINDFLNGTNIDEYGVWAYYPWSQRLVHILDEDEFVEVRTNRNQYKITRAERDILGTKRIGIIGLSVGQSIALTLAMERGFGELRLADFDELELSNLNRIRAGVHSLGLPKVVVTAREIAEIDPYLKITCFFEGLTEENMDDFFLKNGKLDILVDECDGLDIKINSRVKARALMIPVVMDTSDRGMLDVERFDLEPDRPILHGAVEGVDTSTIKELTNEEKIPIILQMLGIENVSLRIKASMIEVEQTINTWPQLASSVVLGGAIGADVCRRILLDQFHDSGRYYIDLDEIVSDKTPDVFASEVPSNPFSPMQRNEMSSLARQYKPNKEAGRLVLDNATITELVNAACAAPSTGNDQPWKWLYRSDNGILFLYHDEYRSFSFGDFQKTASFISFGAAFENLSIHALAKGMQTSYDFLPDTKNERLVAAICFSEAQIPDSKLITLDKAIYKRHTNRNPAPKMQLATNVFEQLGSIAETIPGAKFQVFTDEETLKQLGDIIGACDRTRLLNPAGHNDFISREMRWTSEDAERTRDGIDTKTLGFTNSQLAALNIIRNEKVIRTINKLEGGLGFDGLARRIVKTASAICMITLPEYSLANFFEGGRAMERFWLEATNLNLAVHPVISPFYLFSRILHGNGEGLNTRAINELTALRKQFDTITGLGDNRAEVFLTKIAVAAEPVLKSHRLPLDKVLVFDK
ncbi:Rv1355c family protein [Mucilaginibacter sp. UR6-11]|uniref:Rv1355c family protein n=1 Tax=Mucilaginibacter sp. UR6-11 TaxID=1435644 RepID=UPI001E2CD3B4|nr:Rv1355c family protein [Mucilaginibacter sp. UR6-11]MCC8426836.1 Rv1355c family protein [Mucilaginibacter sp. UR6-11]